MGSFAGLQHTPKAERQHHANSDVFGSTVLASGKGRVALGLGRTAIGPGRAHVAAFDLDGTLTDARLRVVPRARFMIRRLQAQGVRRILITGRTRAELAGRERFLREFDAVLLESGAVDSTEPVEPHRARDGPLDALRTRCEASQVPCRVGQASLSIPIQFGRRFYAWPEASQVTIHVNRDRIDVTPAGEDKGTGLRRTLDRWGVPASRCVAFGDAQNDLPLFSAAGYAVAVGNAEPSVKEAAHEVAPGYGGHAVADFLERRILEDPS